MVTKAPPKKKAVLPEITADMVFNQLVQNNVGMLLSRQALMDGKIIDGNKRDINKECSYPDLPTVELYRQFFMREGIATRVVSVFPDECWSTYPKISTTVKNEETPFEVAWEELDFEHNVCSYLHRVDELSGIGHYGSILLGLDDGLDPSQPAAGLDKTTGLPTDKRPEQKLLYLRAFDEYCSQVTQLDTDARSPRYGLPTEYTVKQLDFTDVIGGVAAVSANNVTDLKVHWTRVVHIADNRKSSEVYGVPRMMPVINRLYDLRKILSGSGEMFWKGAFPGYSFESNADLLNTDFEIDADSLKKQIDAYQNGLQRYLALVGVTAKPLLPQLADPTNHVAQQLQAIAMALGVPYRIFLGSEAAHLASTQDIGTWHRRLARRQTMYLTPFVINPFIRRLMALGILPTVKRFMVDWKDMNALSDSDQADVALKRSQALMAYVTGGVENMIPTVDFLTNIIGIPLAISQAMVDGAKKMKDSEKLTILPPQPAAAPPAGKGSAASGRRATRKPPAAGSSPAA